MFRFDAVCTCQDWVYRNDKMQTQDDLSKRLGYDGQVSQSKVDEWYAQSPSGSRYTVNVYERSSSDHVYLCKHIIKVIETMFAPGAVRFTRSVGLGDFVLARLGEWYIIDVEDHGH